MIKEKLIRLEDAENLNIEEVKKLYTNYVNLTKQKYFLIFLLVQNYLNDLMECTLKIVKKKILDFTGGFGVLNHGHNHTRVLNVRKKKFLEQQKLEVHKIIFSKYLATFIS